MKRIFKAFNGKLLTKSFVILAVLLITVASVMETEQTQAATNSKVSKVSITSVKSGKVKMNKGTTKSLTVKVSTKDTKTSKQFTVKSSNTKVVKAVKSGSKVKLTAVGNGTATVTVYSKADKSKKCSVKVTVVTPVSKVTLNKTSVTSYAGQKVYLSSKITPATASNKKVNWSSSDSRLATVDKNGIVTLKAVGKVTITAKAADGSGKYAKCVITIKQPNIVKSMEYLQEYDIIKVELLKAQKLNRSNFSVMEKSTKRASYVYTNNVYDVTTSDNKTYFVYVENPVVTGHYIKASVTGLEGISGAYSKEAKVMSKNMTTYDYVGSYYTKVSSSSTCYINFNNIVGKCSVMATGLTDEMKLVNNTERVYVAIYPKNVGKHTVTIQAKDEYGHVEKHKYYIIITDSTHVYGAFPDRYFLQNKDGSAYVYGNISRSGGSGSYKYEIVGENYGIKISNSGSISGSLSKAGDYTLRVKVSDANDSSIFSYVDCPIHILKTYKVSGKITDALGNPMLGAQVEAVNDNPSYPAYMISDSTDYNGLYDCYLTPGKYTLRISPSSSKIGQYYFNITVTDKDIELNYKLNFYKITLNIDSKYKNLSYWENENEIHYGYADRLYLPKGKYNLTTTAKDSTTNEYVTLVIDVNVTGEMTVTVKKQV